VGAEKRKRLTKEDAKTLLAMLEAEPFTFDDLPPVLQRTLRADDGSFGVFAYPAFDAADMKKGVTFTRETRSYVDDGSLFVGETTVYAAMFLMLREEAPIVLSLAAVFVTVLVFWQLRSVKWTLLTLLPLGVALWWLVGVMGAIDLRFTLFNLPILPAILGIGVDNGVYLTDRIRRSKGEADGLFKSLQETGGAIMAAMATTAIGFAAFMVGDSAGVRGIGAVAFLGIVLASLSATLVLPAVVGLRRKR
jgi:predicted RND superfamily exporter protein